MAPIRRLTVDDLEACLDLAENRGWGREALKWRFLLENGRAFGFDVERGVLGGSSIVATYGHVGFLGMVVVRRAFGARGFGKQLVQTSLERSNVSTALLFATAEGAPLYASLGFATRELYVTHSGTYSDSGDLRAYPVQTVAAGELNAPQIDALVASDAAAFGAPRGAMLRSLIGIGLRVAMLRDSDSLHFALAWPDNKRTRIGPIVAGDDTIAAALVDALAHRQPDTFRVDVPARSTVFRDWLTASGLTRGGDDSPLMTRGDADKIGSDSRYCANAMQALG